MASITSLSNSSYSTSSIYGSRNVLSGLASGMDTESMIENAVAGIRTKIASLQKRRTKVEWQQEGYRSIIDKMVNMNDKYTSYASATNLSSNSFFSNAVNTSTLGEYKDKVTASGKTSSDVKLLGVKQLAKAATYNTASLGGQLAASGTNGFTGDMVSLDEAVDVSNVAGHIFVNYGKNNSYDITLDESTTYESMDELAAEINKQLKELSSGIESNTKASDYVEARVENGRLVLDEKDSVSGSTKGNSVTASLSGKIADTLSADKVGGDTELTLKEGKELIGETTTVQESLKDKELSVTLNGVTKKINTSDLAEAKDQSELGRLLQQKLDKAFGKGKVEAKLSAAGEDGGFTISMNPKEEGATLSVGGSAASALGFSTKTANYLDTGKKLGDLVDTSKWGLDTRIAAKGEVREVKTKDETYYVDEDGNRVVHTYDDKDGEYFRVDSEGSYLHDFNINGTTIAVSENTTMENLMNSINSNAEAGVKVSYSKTTGEFQFTATETGSNSRIEFDGIARQLFGDTGSSVKNDSYVSDVLGDAYSDGDKFSVEIDGKTYDVDISAKTDEGGTTVKALVDQLNTKLKEDGLQAVYDEFTGALSITDSDGEAADYSFADGSAGQRLFNTAQPSGYTAGQDAILSMEVNGKTFDGITRSGNSFDVDGLTINLKGTFGDYAEESSTLGPEGLKTARESAVTFETTTDSDKIVDAIKSFVEDYNAMVTEIKNAYSTQPATKSDGSRYEPLTDDDTEGMSDSAIERYEELAKQGILFGDSNLSRAYDRLRSAITPGGTDGQVLRDIGLETSYSNGLTTISLDESKLRAALESDPDKVRNAFTKTKEGGSASDGLMTTMKNVLDTYAKRTGEPKGVLITRAGSIKAPTTLNNNSLQTQMNNIDNQIERWQDKMSTQIDRYTTQFSKLEQLIAEMNSQSSALAGLMGGSSY